MNTSIAYKARNVRSAAASIRHQAQNYPCVDCDILVVTQSSEAAVAIERGLRASSASAGGQVHRCHSIELALRIATKQPIGIAFLGCGLPGGVFRQVRTARLGHTVRIIGIRESDGTLQAIRLVARRLIDAYVHLPASPALLEAMVQQFGTGGRVHDRHSLPARTATA